MNDDTVVRQPTEPAGWVRRFPTLATLLGVLAVSCLLWGFFLVHSGQNYQEQYNLQLVTQSTPAQVSHGSADDPMPLYYLLLDGYTNLAGHTLSDARLLSLACLVLSVLAACAVGTRMSGDQRVGRLAAAFVGLSPFILWYGSRATMYALLLLLTLLNQYFFTAILERPRWWHWLGYGLTGLLGLGVHFFFLLILLLQVAFFAVKHRERTGSEWLGIGTCLAVFAAAFALWLSYSLGHASFWHSLPYTARPSATNTFIIYVQYLFGFQSVVTTTLIIALWPLLVILALLAVQKYARPPAGVQYALWAATAPVIVIFALGWVTRPLFLASYLIVCAAPFMLFLSWYFVALNLRALALARTLLLAGMVLAFFVQAADANIALREDYLGQLDNSQPAKLVTLPGLQ